MPVYYIYINYTLKFAVSLDIVDYCGPDRRGNRDIELTLSMYVCVFGCVFIVPLCFRNLCPTHNFIMHGGI